MEDCPNRSSAIVVLIVEVQCLFSHNVVRHKWECSSYSRQKVSIVIVWLQGSHVKLLFNSGNAVRIVDRKSA
jgi:hypothetical protein